MITIREQGTPFSSASMKGSVVELGFDTSNRVLWVVASSDGYSSSNMDKYGTANHPHLEPLHRTTKFDMSIKPQVCPVVFTNLAIPFTGASYIYYPPQLFILAELLGGASLLVNSLYPHLHGISRLTYGVYV